MPTVIPVRMHYSAQDLWFNPKSTGAAEGDHVVVSTERGTEFGLATADPFEVPAKAVKGELKPVLRIATDKDLEKAEALAEKGDEAMPVFRELVKASGLDMKPVGVEFLFGGEKAVFYFAAEDRVDFRELVRELASRFHQRVDMRQIGVRDEARLVGGYSTCGQELCCVRFGGEFEPVSIRMAKEQDLPLNSAKISGVCGRLMCCLRYEFEAYRDFKQRAPKKNAVIDTPLGKAKIVEYNTPRETLRLRLENGKSFTVALADMSCSEGCRKRSEEQNIPLRPDTVTREALEALGTADIAMQLAELDRASDPLGGYVLDDSLLEGRKPRRTSRGGGSGTGEERGAAGQNGTGEGGRRRRGERDGQARTAGEATRTPRRTSRGGEGGAQQDGETAERQQARGKRGGAAPETAADGQQRRQPRGGGMRPRRSKANAAAGGAQGRPEATGGPDGKERPPRPGAAGNGGANGTAARQAQQPTRRTRRHHTASENAGGAAARGEERRQQPQGAQERRRGGDPGGDRARGASESAEKRRRTRSGGQNGKPAPGSQNQADTGRQPRRRRPGDRGGQGASND